MLGCLQMKEHVLYFLLNLVYQEEDLAAPAATERSSQAGDAAQRALHAAMLERAARLHALNVSASLRSVRSSQSMPERGLRARCRGVDCVTGDLGPSGLHEHRVL